MKIAITGISGYLGRLLARSLGDDPIVESILGLDIVPPGAGLSKVVFQEADVRTADFADLLKGVDAVFHLAFIVEPRRELSEEDIEAINVEGSKRLFEAAAAAGVPKIIHASSVAAYGAHADNPEPLTEDMPLRPNKNWYYSRTKGRVEEFLDEFQQRHPDIVIVRLRPCVFLGPTINNSMIKIYTGRAMISINPSLRLDHCWDEDIAEAFRLALRCEQSDIFNLAAEGPLCTNEIGAILGKRIFHVNRGFVLIAARLLCGLRLITRNQLEWLDVASRGSIIVSSERARQRLGWSPRYNGAEVVRKIAALPPIPGT